MCTSTRMRGRHGAPAALFRASLMFAVIGCEEISGVGQNSAILWRTPLEARDARVMSAPATDGKRVYHLGSGVVAFDAATGTPLWRSNRFPTSQPTSLVVQDGRIFTAEATAFALDAESGRELWRFSPDASAALSQNTADERAFYVGTTTHRVYALGAVDGALLWTVDVGPGWQHEGAVKGIARGGDTVYVAAERSYSANGYYSAGVIVALDRMTGRELWRYQDGTGSDSRGVVDAPTVAGRFILMSDLKGHAFYAVDRFTGQEVWRVNTEAGFMGPGQAPVVKQDVVYASAIDAYVYAMELHTGKILWKTRPAMGGSTKHAVCANTVLNNFQSIGMIDRQTGKVRRIFHREGEIFTSGFAVYQDLVFVSSTEAIYSLKCP